MQPALLALLASKARTYPAVLPLLDGQPEPLCSAVRLEALVSLHAMFESGERAARVLGMLPGADLVPEQAWRAVDPEGRSFIGVNTPAQLANAEVLRRECSL
jgi:molybdopterin-guanine dinucleotide biosynthesis protein A